MKDIQVIIRLFVHRRSNYVRLNKTSMALSRYRRRFEAHHLNDEDRQWYTNQDGSPKFNAFSHSEQCDKLLETLEENRHTDCHCRCHVLSLDLDPDIPPDFVRDIVDSQDVEVFLAEHEEVPIAEHDTLGEIFADDKWWEASAMQDEPSNPVCELCSELIDHCDCVTFDEVLQVFKNARGEVINARA